MTHVCVYIYRFSDKEKQLFWNSKFHAALSAIFSQLTLTLNCYGAMVSFWRHLISLLTKVKNTPQPCDEAAHQRTLQETLHTPSARCGRDPDITFPYAKTQDCSIFSTSTQMKYHSLLGTTLR